MNDIKFDFIIIGGGFFGAYIAHYLEQKGKKVFLIEKEKEILKRASFVNQARVHNGYHYPRSASTAARSRVLSPKFVDEFQETITHKTTSHYLIAKHLSKVSTPQFEEFCRKIHAPLKEAKENVKAYINDDLVENIFEVEEFFFDAFLLRNHLLKNINNSKITLTCESEVIGIKENHGDFEIQYKKQDDIFFVRSQQVINCTYSMLNKLSALAGFSPLPLKHELTEICLVSPPEELAQLSFTALCGPFFSFTEFPASNSHLLTHVRYTPHLESHNDELVEIDLNKLIDQRKSNFSKMIRDASRFIPLIGQSVYKESLWEIKTVLPKNEYNDGRPVLVKLNYRARGFHCILGGKIDNIYDAIDAIEKRLI